MRLAAWCVRTLVYAAALLVGADRGLHRALTDLYPAPRLP